MLAKKKTFLSALRRTLGVLILGLYCRQQEDWTLANNKTCRPAQGIAPLQLQVCFSCLLMSQKDECPSGTFFLHLCSCKDSCVFISIFFFIVKTILYISTGGFTSSQKLSSMVIPSQPSLEMNFGHRIPPGALRRLCSG